VYHPVANPRRSHPAVFTQCAGPTRRRRSFLTLDVIGAISIVTIMAMLFALGVRQYSRARHETDTRRAARAAAELELHRLWAGLAELPTGPKETRRVSSDLELQTTVAPGTGVWRGFDRVTVVARRRSKHGHWARVELSAYLPNWEQRP
jgi:hypothetical protein